MLSVVLAGWVFGRLLPLPRPSLCGIRSVAVVVWRATSWRCSGRGVRMVRVLTESVVGSKAHRRSEPTAHWESQARWAFRVLEGPPALGQAVVQQAEEQRLVEGAPPSVRGRERLPFAVER